MRFFRRPAEAEAMPTIDPLEIEQTGSPALAVCGSEYCADNEPSDSEISCSDEILLEQMDEAINGWGQEIESAKERTVGVMAALQEAAIRHIDQSGGGRADRRVAGQAKNVPNYNANQLAMIRHQTIAHITKVANQAVGAEASLERLSISSDEGQLRSHLQGLETHLANVLQGSACGTVDAAGTKIAEPFQRLFLREHIARTWLALGSLQRPDLMRQYFSPANIGMLPITVQRFAAADIARGRGGSLILNLHGDSLRDEALAGDAYLAYRRQYLARNNIPPQAQAVLGGMTVGACAEGAARCPANKFGLCAQVLEKIPYEGLPADIQTDLAKKSQVAAETTISELQSFASQPAMQLSKWWRSAEHIPFDNGQVAERPGGKKRKQAGQLATAQSVADSLTPSTAEAAEERQRQLLAHWKQSEAPVAVDMADEQQRTELVSSILASKEFVAYIAKYAEEKELPAMLGQALETILFTRRYRDEPSIVRMSYTEPFYDEAGNALPIWRLSGSAMKSPAGKVGHQTRIYFGMRGDADSRYVRIIGVRHKSDVAKRMARSAVIV